MNDSLGDRMKAYEEQETHARFLPNVPIVARIDGRCFSKLTKGLDRPFDLNFSQLMRDVTYHLVRETSACIGYTQSDEINLCWYASKPGSDIFFGGRKFKMTAQLAAIATAYFQVEGRQYLAENLLNRAPTFDARVFQVPTLAEGVNALLWRQRDCRKNAISMVARSLYSHAELLNKNGDEMLAMIAAKGVSFSGSFPWQSREGTFIRKEIIERELTPLELVQIPEKNRPVGKVMRSHYAELQLPLLSELENATDVVFFGAEPLQAELSTTTKE